MPEQEMNPTLGALGNERPKRKSRKRLPGDEGGSSEHHQHRRHRKKAGSSRKRTSGRNERDVIVNVPTTRNVLPAFTDAPRAPAENLAGKPDLLQRSDLDVKKVTQKHATPYHTGDLNTESFLHFVIHSNSQEWIRFNRNSLSMVVFFQYKNANYQAGGDPNTENGNEWHATNASQNKPNIFCDPDVMGSGFFNRVEVVINNVPVPTNSGIADMFLHYCRSNRVFNAHNKDPHFVFDTNFKMDAANINSEVMKAATRAFSHGDWNSRVGVRIPIFLDGIFPFDLKSDIVQSLEAKKQEKLYFVPNTALEVKLYYQRTKMEAIWHSEMTSTRYFSGTEAVNPPVQMRMGIQSAALEYESVELHPAQHIELLKSFSSNKFAYYQYDIPRGQHQSLTHGASITDNSFQIMPFARLIIILFLKDWSCFPMENKRRPLSGWSQFPANCTKLRLAYAGEPYLITESFNRFGIAGEQNHLSKKTYYEYMLKNRFTSLPFEAFFPKDPKVKSLVQGFVIDVRNHMSKQTKLLHINCEFAGANTSPADTQIAVISVHPNGEARCRNVGTGLYDWEWEFLQPV